MFLSHYLIRRLIMVVMIALLPLQGWAGGAMATQMAAFAVSQSAGASAVAADPSARPVELSAAAMPDCPGHAQAGAVLQAGATQHGAGPSGFDGTTQGNAESCSACQVCHSVALAPLLIGVLLAASSATQPLAVTTSFTSAAPALGQKPPIS